MVIRMRILLLDWGAFGQKFMLEAFRDENCEVEVFKWPFGKSNMRENEELCSQLEERIGSRNYHFVFSFNFFPVAAQACYKCGTRYVSWIYDSPYMLLYSKHIFYSTNRVNFFDKSLFREFQKIEGINAYYLPMAAPVDYYDKVITDGKNKNQSYQSEISFVGSTYNSEQGNFYQYLKGVNPYTAGYLNAITKVQKEVYGSFMLEELLTQNIVDELQRVCPIQKEEDEWESDAWIYANYFLAKKLTGEQRMEILKMLADHYQVKLYSGDKAVELENVEECGIVEYETEMPLVFYNSKINLNMTLRSIYSGIPLRAMDIMGCGGFLLTNFQEDFLDFFEPGIDYLYYESNEDLLVKAEYYLRHEDERKRIAQNGYEKVKKYHTYRHRARIILEEVMGEEEKAFNDAIIACEKIREKQGGEYWYKEFNPQWETMSKEELRQDTDKKMQWMQNEQKEDFDLKNSILAVVDKALSEGGKDNYELLCSCFLKPIAGKISAIFPEIYYVLAFVKLYLEEKSAGVSYTIEKFSNHKELEQLFQQMTFYFRRIENDLPRELQREIFDYIREKQLNYYAMLELLEMTEISDKGKVRSKLNEFWKQERELQR